MSLITMAACFGYRSFTPWTTSTFFLYYTMILLAPIAFAAWRLLKKTRWLRRHELDLTWEAELIAAYEAAEEEQPTSFWREISQIVDFRGLYRGSVTRFSD